MPLLRARPFGCTQLEALFRHQLLHRSAADVLRLLSILVPVQLLLALFRVPQPDLTLLWLAGSASLGLALALVLACSASSAQHPLVPLCALWLCAHPLALLPWPGLALLPSLMAIFLLYAFFPFPLHWTALLCAFLSMAQLGAMLAVGGPGLGMANVAASLLAQIWVHVVGIYAQLTGRKIGRAVFLNARNALDSDRELQMEVKRMANLLSGSLPPHIVQSVQSQLGGSEVPRVFVEHFGQCSVVFARFYGLPSILAQLQVSDSARLLNEFDWRIRTLAESSGLLLLPSQSSECVLALAGVPESRADHAAVACQFGADLLALVHSFGGATSSQLQLRVGIGSGSLSAGIVGSRRWRYDVLGMAVDAAMHLEGICPAGTVLLSEDTWRQLGGKFTAERLAQGAWQLSVPASEPSSAFGRPLLFPQPPRRFSLLTLQQAVLRLLHQQQPLPRVGQSPAAVAPATPFTKRSAGGGKAKGKGLPRMGSCRQLDSLLGPSWPAGLRLFSLHFDDVRLDRAFHAQPDHWLIPGLALCVLFLGLFGLFQALAMPRMLPNLATLGLALGLMFLLLLALYVNFLESFCQFVTRTALGHSVAVLLVLAALCTCGLANTFSCPLEASTASSAICQPVQLPAVSLALWMFLPTLFVRLSSLLSLLVLMAALGLFCLHLFVTHAALYPDLLSRIDLLGALIGLALLLFMLARRNELLLRMDFLALLKSVDDARKIERIEFLNDQILLNALPAHIAFNFAGRADPYAHLCPSVGVLCARLGRSGDWVGEFGFDRLNRLVCEIDQRLGQLSEQRLEKVRTGHCFYTAACGVLPEMAKNVHDAPCTIGEQLASLAQLAEFIQEAAEAECLDVAIGLDCGAALSAVIGGDRPRYELLGQPITRARKLAEAASALGGGCVLLSEDVFLALRPRSQFHFDERSALSVGPGLVAYSLLRSRTQQPQQQQQPKSVEPPPPPPHRGAANQGGEGGESQRNGNSQPIKATANNNSPTLGPLAAIPLPHIRSNPLADGRLVSSSAQSLCSSELFSVDLSVETDSLELEWVTPEMVANGQYRPYQFHEPASYKGDRAGFYSELSVNQSAGGGGGSQQPFNGFEEDKKRPVRPKTAGKSSRPRNGSRSSANISSFGSELSLPTTAVGTSGQFTLNLAAKKVDRMLKEMAGLQGLDPPVPECPFPRELAQPPHQQQSQPSCSRHGNNNNGTYDSRCLSEYENNDSRRSLANCGGSDSEAGGFGGSFSRLDRLKRALLLGRGAGRTNNISSGNVKGPGSGGAQQPSAKRKAAPDGGTRDGNEADRSCSPSVTSSQILPLNRRSAKAAQLLGMRWRHSSAHSIGYEDEYELTSAPLSSYSSSAVSLGWESKPLPSVGENSLFAPIDAEEALEEADQQKTATNDEDDACLRIQMLELTRDIRRNFGDFQLASFEAESSKAAEVDRRKEEE